MTNEKIILDRRLGAVSSLVRAGVTLYDVGSDHAYLPAYLLQEGIIPRAVVSDINEGPISRARATLENAGVMDRAQTVLTDGLNGIVLLPPCDVSVAGMGGELISSIIDAKPELKDGRINLILQPMTKPEVLRAYLSSNGYEIQKEITVTEGKIYTVILCSYTGKPYSLTEAELYVGVGGAREESDEFYSLVKSKISILRAIADGKRLGGGDVSDEERLISSLETILNERGKK